MDRHVQCLCMAIAGLSPFWLLYALHDALVKPMPGNLMTPSLAESWHLATTN